MLDGSSDRFLDFFDRSRSKIGLILLGFMVMVPLGLLGVDSVGKSSDGERLYPVSGSSDSGRDGDSAGIDGASSSGLDVESSERSPNGPSKRRSGSSVTSVAGGATGGQSSMVDNDVTTLGPEQIEPIGPDDLTLDSSGVGSTVAPPTTKKPVTTRRKAKTTTTRRLATTTTKRRTTTTKRRATTTRKPTTVPPATVVVGPQPTLGPPPPTALLDAEPPNHIDK